MYFYMLCSIMPPWKKAPLKSEFPVREWEDPRQPRVLNSVLAAPPLLTLSGTCVLAHPVATWSVFYVTESCTGRVAQHLAVKCFCAFTPKVGVGVGVVCKCGLTVRTSTTDTTVLLFQLATGTLPTVTSFLAPNSDFWSHWNKPLYSPLGSSRAKTEFHLRTSYVMRLFSITCIFCLPHFLTLKSTDLPLKKKKISFLPRCVEDGTLSFFFLISLVTQADRCDHCISAACDKHTSSLSLRKTSESVCSIKYSYRPTHIHREKNSLRVSHNRLPRGIHSDR